MRTGICLVTALTIAAATSPLHNHAPTHEIIGPAALFSLQIEGAQKPGRKDHAKVRDFVQAAMGVHV